MGMIKLVTLLLSATGAVAVPRHPDAPILDLPDDDNIAGSSSFLLADFTRRTKLTLQSPQQHASAYNSRNRDEASLGIVHGQDKRPYPTTSEDGVQVQDLKLDDDLGGEINADLHYPAQRAINKPNSERDDEPTDEEFIDYYYSDDTTMPYVGLEYKSQHHQLDEKSVGEVREEDVKDLDTDYNDEEQAEVDVETYSSDTEDDDVVSINQPTVDENAPVEIENLDIDIVERLPPVMPTEEEAGPASASMVYDTALSDPAALLDSDADDQYD